MNVETKEIFYEKLTFMYVELEKFIKDSQQLENDLEEWIFVFKNMANFDNIPSQVQQNSIFLKLFEQCEIAKYSPKERDMYDQSIKTANDWFAIKKHLKNEVIEEGMEKGAKQTEERKNREIISNLVKKGFSNEIIYKIISIPISEIKKIRKELGI